MCKALQLVCLLLLRQRPNLLLAQLQKVIEELRVVLVPELIALGQLEGHD